MPRPLSRTALICAKEQVVGERHGGILGTMADTHLPRPVLILGLAGLLPQVACLAVVLLSPEWRWTALAAGSFYAALILSFLGGMWWMQALLRRVASPLPYLVAVAPSLLAWVALLPWCFGWTWPGGWLVTLALLLVASPLVDMWLPGRQALPEGWLRLRILLAAGLGLLSAALLLA